MSQPEHVPEQTVIPVCYRHPDRQTYIRCSRCDRPICPDCMIAASVGYQCPECVREGAASTRQARTVFGGRVNADGGYVTKVLIALNVVAFLVQQASSTFALHFELIGRAFAPELGPGLAGVGAGEAYRLLTAAFLHGGLFHIGSNMLALWLFGPSLEGALGRLRFAALYLVAALGGSVVSYAFADPRTASLGASGAVFGLFGAQLVVNRKLGRDLTGLYVLLALNLGLGFAVAGIDWHAHLGGLATGTVLALALVHLPPHRRGALQAAAFAAVVVVLLGVAVGRTAHLTDTPVTRVLSCQVTAPLEPDQTFDACVQPAS